MIIPESASYLYMPITRNIPIDILHAGSWFNKLKKWRGSLPEELLMEDFYQILPKSINKVFGFSDTVELCCFVPKGFLFNGASIPRALAFIYLPDDILYLGAFLHDFMYSYAGLMVFTEDMDEMIFSSVSRSGADYIFNEMNEIVNDFTTGTYPAYRVLKLVGGSVWDKCRISYSFIRDFPQYEDIYLKGKLNEEALWEN